MRIMVVDDDKMVLKALDHNLKSKGHEVFTADNGLDALEICGKQKLDLIITDVLMPDFSGLNLLSMLKQFYLMKVPVIIISSLDKNEVVASSQGLGADDFLKKPIDYDELDLRLRKYSK